MKKRTKPLLSREYPVVITYDEDDDLYIAKAIDLPGCHSDGRTPEEASEHIYEAIEGWLETAEKNGISIPTRTALSDRKEKKFLLRIAPKNGAKLELLSRIKGKSLNYLINDLIAAG